MSEKKQTEKPENLKYWSGDKIRSIKGLKYAIIYGKRSAGKTYDREESYLKHFWEHHGEPLPPVMIYLRRRDKDLTPALMSTVCNNLLMNGEGVNVVKEITNGQFDNIIYQNRKWFLCKYDPETQLTNKDRSPFMIAYDLYETGRSKVVAHPNCDVIWFEEFIPLSHTEYLKDEYVLFTNFIKTIVKRRDDITIWMTGNSVDPFSPYWDWMGLSKVREQKPGTIDIYHLGDTDKVIAVERTKDSGVLKESKETNDYLFAFDTPELKMITDDEWQIGSYPLMERTAETADICGTFFIKYKERLIQCDIVSNDTDQYIYAHSWIDPANGIDEEYDLIYSLNYSSKPNYRRRFDYTLTDAERVIYTLIKMDKVFFDTNWTGLTFDGFREDSRPKGRISG